MRWSRPTMPRSGAATGTRCSSTRFADGVPLLLRLAQHEAAGLLPNLPPDRRGMLDLADRARLLDSTGEPARRLAEPVPCTVSELRIRLSGEGVTLTVVKGCAAV